MSGFSKVIASGKLGSVEVSEEKGVASLKGTVSADIGIGQLKSALKVHNSTQIDMDAMDLVFVGFDLLEAKLPVSKVPLEALKKLIMAELPLLEEKFGSAPAALVAPAAVVPEIPGA